MTAPIVPVVNEQIRQIDRQKRCNIKRGYYGTFHHFSKKHIDRYVDEFVFRLNQGNVKIKTIDRMASLVTATQGKKLSYKDLIGQK